ncbi:MAG: hypothetical protein IJK18_06265 [Clostridia bacterium]|nr:hypothetical protein [Clostridia bacterium]
MKKLLGICLIIIIVYSIIITILYINNNNSFKEAKEKLNIFEHTEAPPITHTFYARIQNIDKDKNTILVKGLEFDTIYNKKYLLKISEETLLIGNGNTDGSNVLVISSFNNNQYISVTYAGAIEISNDYDIIGKITKIQLLEDRNK